MKTVKPPLYTKSILARHATDTNVYHLAEGTNGKFRVNKLWELPESWRHGNHTHVWSTLTVKDTFDDAYVYMMELP